MAGATAHEHDHGHEHRHPHDHDHDHPHDHTHPHGVLGAIRHALTPHSHDAADRIDDALESTRQGVRALWISMVVLGATTVLQLAVVLVSGSVALLADTVHNLSDALTAVPLLAAFALGRRPPTRRYGYGLGRAEDLAGLFIIAVVALSAVVAAWQSIDRLLHPRPIENVGWVIAAGVIGFAGNEIVAAYRIRTGRRIGSAALVADGVHARTDGFTSLAVVLGGIGVLVGLPLADPIVGLIISIAIVGLLVGTVRSIGRRLLDGVEPELLHRAEHAAEHAEGVRSVDRVRLRWVGHRLHGDLALTVDADSLARAAEIAADARARVSGAVPGIDDLVVTTAPAAAARSAR